MKPTSARTRGKEEERRVAKALGAIRIGASGKADPDLETDSLVIEVKNVAEKGIRGQWIETIKTKALKRKKNWLLVKRTKGEHQRVCVLDFDFFLELFSHMPIDGREGLLDEAETLFRVHTNTIDGLAFPSPPTRE